MTIRIVLSSHLFPCWVNPVALQVASHVRPLRAFLHPQFTQCVPSISESHLTLLSTETKVPLFAEWAPLSLVRTQPVCLPYPCKAVRDPYLRHHFPCSFQRASFEGRWQCSLAIVSDWSPLLSRPVKGSTWLSKSESYRLKHRHQIASFLLLPIRQWALGSFLAVNHSHSEAEQLEPSNHLSLIARWKVHPLILRTF